MTVQQVRRDWDTSAGRLCLDFTNTAEWHASAHPEEHLRAYPDLVGWALAEALLTKEQATSLLEVAASRPHLARQTMAVAIQLREAVYRILVACLNDQTPTQQDVDLLNRNLTEAMIHARLTPAGEGFAWGWEDAKDLHRMLWPVARSAADLLASPDLGRVGQCADDRGCGWLFFDTSRNHSRRWCSMEDCGNRAKAKRHQARECTSA